MRADVKALGDAVIASVKGYVSAAVASLSERFAELDARLNAIPAGPQGERGEKGERGDPGERGEAGVALTVDDLLPTVRECVVAAVADIPVPKDGKDGSVGEKGERGEKGEPGPPGDVGPPGRDGTDGKDGAPGEPGANGRDGIDGKDGKDGKDGEPGAPGRDGIDGKDGKDGELGPRGADGAPGVQGPPGADGTPGIQGPPGQPGEKGFDGRDGKDGRDGRDGKDGAPGRDALEIEILPALDETRSYPRGTFAEFAGGLIRAVRNTDPMKDGAQPTDAGWTFIVRGVASIEVKQEHERTFDFAITYSDGAVDRKSFSTPVMIWRGIFREGAYERGDTVTWGGSLWHCNEPTCDKPGESKAWALAVKRGRDGKDGDKP